MANHRGGLEGGLWLCLCVVVDTDLQLISPLPSQLANLQHSLLMATSTYQFPLLFVTPLECLCPSWPAYETRWTRSRKVGTFGWQAQSAAVQARARVRKRNQVCNEEKSHDMQDETLPSLPPEAAGAERTHSASSGCLFPRTLADALARGNASRALRLRQRAQVEASLATASTSSSFSSVSSPSTPSCTTSLSENRYAERAAASPRFDPTISQRFRPG